jgi:hypothetical protein
MYRRDAWWDEKHPLPNGLAYDDVPQAFQTITRSRDRTLQQLLDVGELRPGENVPDHWFDLASPGRAGVRRAAECVIVRRIGAVAIAATYRHAVGRRDGRTPDQ